MIGQLPKALTLGDGKSYEIRSDYRVALLIMQAYNDDDLTEFDLIRILIECLFVNPEEISQEYMQDAINKAVWFLNCGKDEEEHPRKSAKLYDWEQDEQMIFSAVNKVAGREIRSDDYLHWWSFMGLFNEIGEGTFSTVVAIRDKKNKHKKLEKWEQEYYRKNPETVKLKRKLTQEEQETMSFLDELLAKGDDK